MKPATYRAGFQKPESGSVASQQCRLAAAGGGLSRGLRALCSMRPAIEEPPDVPHLLVACTQLMQDEMRQRLLCADDVGAAAEIALVGDDISNMVDFQLHMTDAGRTPRRSEARISGLGRGPGWPPSPFGPLHLLSPQVRVPIFQL